jgi:LysM repeat protein
MDARTRRKLSHYGAPAAFLLVVTIAVLLIKAGLAGHHKATTTQQPTAARTRTSATTSTNATTSTTATVARYYTIQSGDTLAAIAIREHTTVADLLRLNPGIDPTALHSGQRIRVG